MAKSASRKTSGPVRPKSSRLSREQWLEGGMRLLEERGPAAMTLESLTRYLDVTTGSFYWHFTSHFDFLEKLTDNWARECTRVVADHLATLDLPPKEMLREAMYQIVGQGLAGLDVHFRSLALSYPQLAEKIRGVDELRSSVITGLFGALGYSGDALRMRVHAFTVLHAFEHGMTTPVASTERLQLLDERLSLFLGE